MSVLPGLKTSYDRFSCDVAQLPYEQFEKNIEIWNVWSVVGYWMTPERRSLYLGYEMPGCGNRSVFHNVFLLYINLYSLYINL